MAKEVFQRTKPHVNVGMLDAIGTKTLKLNASGPEVKKLQAFLIKETKVKLNPSGTFDAATEDAVKRWQKKNKLKADGVFDPAKAIAALSGGDSGGGGGGVEVRGWDPVKKKAITGKPKAAGAGGGDGGGGGAGRNDMRQFKSTCGHLLNTKKQLRAMLVHLDRAEKMFKQMVTDDAKVSIRPAEFHKEQERLAHELAHVLQQYNQTSWEFLKERAK